jgi:hypothetical protein
MANIREGVQKGVSFVGAIYSQNDRRVSDVARR